jgi:hypothetical protein
MHLAGYSHSAFARAFQFVIGQPFQALAYHVAGVGHHFDQCIPVDCTVPGKGPTMCYSPTAGCLQ